MHLAAALLAHDPFSRLWQLKHGVFAKLSVEQLNVAIAYRREETLHDLSILYFTHSRHETSASTA